MKKLRNIHPGEILLEEFLKHMALSQNALARVLGTTEQFWMGLQMDYDLEQARAASMRALAKVRRVAA